MKLVQCSLLPTGPFDLQMKLCFVQQEVSLSSHSTESTHIRMVSEVVINENDQIVKMSNLRFV